MTLLQKIASNTLSQVFSKFGTAVISIFLLGILTKYLPLEMFGMYNKVYNYLGIFAFLADLGLYTITIREITHHKNNAGKIVGNVLTLRVLLGIIICILALVWAYFLPGYNSSLAIISIAIVWIFTVISLVNSSILALMQSYMKIEFSFFSVIAGKLLNIALVCYVVFFLYPLDTVTSFSVPLISIFVAGLLGITLTTAMNYVYAHRNILPVTFAYDRDYISHLFRISLPYGIALFLGVVYFKVDVVLLSILEPASLGNISIALYALPMKIVEVLMVLWGFYLNSLLPSLTQAFQKKDTLTVQKLVLVSFRILLSFGVCIFVFGTLFAQQIIRIIANENYLQSQTHMYTSIDVFSIVLAVLLFHFLSLIFVYVLIAVKKQSQLLYINLVVTLCNIVGNILLIPYFSFLGAGIVTVVSQILLMILGYISVRRIVKIPVDISFIVYVCSLGALLFHVGTTMISWYPLGSIGEVFVYGTILTALYTAGVYAYMKKSFTVSG